MTVYCYNVSLFTSCFLSTAYATGVLCSVKMHFVFCEPPVGREDQRLNCCFCHTSVQNSPAVVQVATHVCFGR